MIRGRCLILAGLAAASLLAAPRAADAFTLHRIPNNTTTFKAPVHVAQPPNTSRRLFVVEQPGRIRVIVNGSLASAPFLDIRDRVLYGGEQGLLSVAFPPNYGNGTGSTTRRFYVFFVNNAGDLRIKEYKRSKSSGNRASTSYSRTALAIPHPGQNNHNGGKLEFGPDGFLYAAPGDGGGAGDPNNNAQDIDNLLGKLLRIDPRQDGPNSHSNPPDNPFAGSIPGAGEIYSLGLRNPFRFSFDDETLTIGDVGQARIEEVDILSLAAAKGANFGWSGYEGPEVFNDDRVPANPTFPVFYYCHPQIANPPANCSPTVTGRTITGGHIVRDPDLPSLTGRYLYADFFAGALRSFAPPPSNPFTTDAALTGNPAVPNLSSFGVDSNDNIYIASLNGPVYQLDP